MGAEIYVQLKKCKDIESRYTEIKNCLLVQMVKLDLIKHTTGWNKSFSKVQKALVLEHKQLASARTKIGILQDDLTRIISLYEECERFIGMDVENYDGKYAGSISDTEVFDEKGAYGGDQGAAQSEWGPWSQKKDLYDTVRKYYPSMTDKEIHNYLKKLNNEGCGYVAIVNTIFAAYQGKEALFERDFGFPMYYKGDLNYKQLVVDFYASTDNHNKVSNIDVISTTEDKSDTEGYGTTPDSQVYRTQSYMAGKSMAVKIKAGEKVTTENYAEYAKNGYVVLNYHSGNLEDENGKTIQKIGADEGHSMTVTGVTEDGRFIVSSWGRQMYLKPNDATEFVYYQYSMNIKKADEN